jgi:hypothetical protein
MELVSATTTQAGTLVVTLAEPRGLLRLEATRAEVAALCHAMEQAAVLARASTGAAWLSDVPAGADSVRIGIGGGRVRLSVG